MFQKQLNGFNKYKIILFEFVKRDLKIRYRKSFLGIIWTLLNPLMSMAIMTFVFSRIFKNNIQNFPVYLLSGQTIFNFFSESTTNGMNSILSGSTLLKKVYIPKYIFPLSKVLSALVNFLASMIALIIVMVVTKTPINISIIFIIFPMIYILLFAFGMSLFLSSVAVYFRDTLHLYSVILTLWTYTTPLFYPIEILPDFTRTIVQLNPLTNICEYLRIITLYGIIPSFELNLICLIPGMLSFIIGFIVFFRTQDKFILHI